MEREPEAAMEQPVSLPFTKDIPPGSRPERWSARLDTVGALCGALMPVGLVIGSTGFELLVALGILSWMVRAFLSKDFSFRKTVSHPLTAPLMAWYATILISLIWNGPGSKGMGHDVAIVRFGLFIMALLDISRRKPVAAWMAYGLGAGVAFAAINTLAAYGFGFDLLGNPLSRYTEKLREAARIANTGAYALPFFLGWGLTDSRLSPKVRFLVLGLAVITGIQLAQTHIRTTLLASAAGVLFFIFYRIRKHIPRWALAVFMCVVILLVFAFFQTVGSRSLASIYDRIYFWKVSFAMWLSHPLVGVGISSFTDVYKEMAQSGAIPAFVAPDGSVWHEENLYHAHNILLMLLSTTGVLGTSAFVWLYIRATKLAWSNPERFRAGMTAWPAVLLGIGLTGFNIYSSSYLSLLAFLLSMTGMDTFSEHGTIQRKTGVS